MKNKEEILKKIFDNYAVRFGGSGTIELYIVMDEYAKEVSIDFNKWLNKNWVKYDFEDLWHEALRVSKPKNIEQLFELYLKKD